ncbi:IS66 family insertion sequence element accessory protein TnpA [Lactimicrobium massiliense]|jgi:hypothetical protein|uniref:IS66 family insertion sequence element accessory protein TnpA n=1 Tax=Lactimicrobium massiliense TaxID=2161814 RepID=UPI000D55ECF4|nr:hypothetical protein [Lactimicrobium massiliense]MDD6561303.1 hypothetical protein [Lactimicrobium massiliense]
MNEEEWKLLWNQFELSDESVKEFCSRNGMKPRAFYYFKNKYQDDSTCQLCPVVISHSTETAVSFNGIPVSYDDGISDLELQRIIRLCRDL